MGHGKFSSGCTFIVFEMGLGTGLLMKKPFRNTTMLVTQHLLHTKCTPALLGVVTGIDYLPYNTHDTTDGPLLSWISGHSFLITRVPLRTTQMASIWPFAMVR